MVGGIVRGELNIIVCMLCGGIWYDNITCRQNITFNTRTAEYHVFIGVVAINRHHCRNRADIKNERYRIIFHCIMHIMSWQGVDSQKLSDCRQSMNDRWPNRHCCIDFLEYNFPLIIHPAVLYTAMVKNINMLYY